MFNKKIKIIVLLCVAAILFSCKESAKDYSELNVEAPHTEINTTDYNLDFIELHNYVIDSLQAEETPFFYIVEGGIDIDGDNKEKTISVKCKCLDNCTENDIDLFYSMVLNYIGAGATQQDFRFKTPTVSSDGVYQDFGTVVDEYNLKLYCETESGKVIYDLFIKKGDKIPIEPRYIKES